ncbi:MULTISPECIES: hypothetical protein [Kitasatospora]
MPAAAPATLLCTLAGSSGVLAAGLVTAAAVAAGITLSARRGR